MDEGAVLAVMAMFTGLFGKLKAKGLLTDQDLGEIFDLSTLGLEQMGLHNNPGARSAHILLSQMQAIVARIPPKPGE